MTKDFLQIIVRAKSELDNDWRAFLQFADTDAMMVHEIRGYGRTHCEALTDAWNKFSDDAELYSEDCWEWKH